MKKKLVARFVALSMLGFTPISAMADDHAAGGTTHDWSGFYAGVFAGYGTGGTAYNVPAAGSLLDSTSFINGGMIGGAIGANAQHDAFVFGIEGDVAWSGVSGSSPYPGSPVLYSYTSAIDWMSTLRVRAGYSVNDVLLYATGGAAVAGFTNGISPAPTITESLTALGWTAGVGAEYALNDGLSVKAEYLYTDFGTVTGHFVPSSPLVGFNGDSNLHTVKIGLNYAF